MTSSTYKKIEIVGTSEKSVSAAVENGLQKAAETLKNLSWFEIVETRGSIKDGGVGEYQVTLKVGFRLE